MLIGFVAGATGEPPPPIVGASLRLRCGRTCGGETSDMANVGLGQVTEVERLAAVKKAMHEEQMAREEEEADAIAAAEAADAAIVEGERKRLLMEHAARLKDFLPKGVLASGEDLDLINTVSSRLGEMSMTGTSRAGTRAAGSKAFAM